jgi:hypothetical protein
VREGGSGHGEVSKSIEENGQRAELPVAADADLAISVPSMMSMLIVILYN